MSQTNSSPLLLNKVVTYIPCATSSREKTGNIITFTHFEEGNILTKTSNGAESGDESDNESTMPPLPSEE